MNSTFEYNFIFNTSSDQQTISKKKRKHNESTMKERQHFIDLSPLKDYMYKGDIDDPDIEVGESCTVIISENEISLQDNDTGEKYSIDLPLSTVYERSSGKDKILNYFPSGSLSDPNSILLGYDLIFAIDTNTKENTSVTAIAQCVSQKTESEYCGTITVTCIEWDSSPCPKPEVQAWAVLVNEIIRQLPDRWCFRKIAIVVDSELGALPLYNAQQKPLIDNFYLPPNFTLIYASADNGSEFLPNKLIRLCDTHATKFFKEL